MLFRSGIVLTNLDPVNVSQNANGLSFDLVRMDTSVSSVSGTSSLNGLDAASIVGGAKVEVASVSTTPKSMGSVPKFDGILVPEASLLEFNTDTELNSFNSTVSDPEMPAGISLPASKDVSVGVQPKSNGKPVK